MAFFLSFCLEFWSFCCRQLRYCLVYITRTLYKFSKWTKLKAFADNKVMSLKNSKFFLERVENVIGKVEDASYHHFSLFPTMFSKGLYSRVVESRVCVVNS